MGLMVHAPSPEQTVVDFIAECKTRTFAEVVNKLAVIDLDPHGAKTLIWHMLAEGQIELTPDWKLVLRRKS